MSHIQPFRALRPQADVAKQVASRPYDVLNSQEAREEVAENPYSFLHITKSEVSLPADVDIHSVAVYEKAKENLQQFIDQKTLFREDKPCYYIYQLIMNGRYQTGLVCASSIDDYENDIIKKHEFTRPEKEQDRINHIKTTGAQTGNVFLAYRNVDEIDALIVDWTENHIPVYDFLADDSIQNTIWIVDDNTVTNQITHYFETKVPHTYIADGHHRAASAAKVRKALGDQTTNESNYFLTTLFPSNQLFIMDYNRVVKDLNGFTQEAFLEALSTKFHLAHTGVKTLKPTQLHEFGMYLAGSWYQLIAKENTFTTDPIGILDVSILQDNILNELLGIKDPRTDTRIDFVGGIRGINELQARVDSGNMAVAFSLYPVTIQQLFDIADNGEVMPPKSTWFEPKLRDGVLTHLIYE